MTSAVAAARSVAESMGGRPVSQVIPRPDPQAFAIIMSGREVSPLLQQDIVFFPYPQNSAAGFGVACGSRFSRTGAFDVARSSGRVGAD